MPNKNPPKGLRVLNGKDVIVAQAIVWPSVKVTSPKR